MKIRFVVPGLYRLLFGFLILELVLGGSGHLVSFGGLSLRLILFLLVGIFELFIFMKFSLPLNRSFVLLYCFLSYLTVNALFSGLINPLQNVIDEYFGYLPLLTSLFFAFCFRYKIVDLNDAKKIFLFSCLVLGIVSILLWCFTLVLGPAAYSIIEINFLRAYDLGRLSINGNLVRLFMKGTVFCVVSFLICFYEWLSGDWKRWTIPIMIVSFVSVVISFTLGFYIATVIGIGIVLIKVINLKKNIIRLIIMLFLTLIVLLVTSFKFGVYDLMVERFTSGDYTLSFKLVQTIALFSDAAENIFFGNGLGHLLTIDYGYMTKTGYRFENMWGEILNHFGVIGTVLFLLLIASTYCELLYKTKYFNNIIYAFFALGIVVFVIESLSNPFLNNAIGLTYLSLCIGMTQSIGEVGFKV